MEKSIKEKLLSALGITEEQYEKELVKNEYERAKAMGCVGDYITGRAGQMATNWGAAQQAVDLQQLKLARQAEMMNNTAAQQQAAMANAWNQASMGGYATQPTPFYDKTFGMMHGSNILPTFEELSDPDSAWSLPLDALATMWNARFGYNWVKDEDTAAALDENERMWLMVVKRLSDAGWLVFQQFRQPDSDQVKVAWKLIEKDHGNR
jgi:hypothetical protein